MSYIRICDTFGTELKKPIMRCPWGIDVNRCTINKQQNSGVWKSTLTTGPWAGACYSTTIDKGNGRSGHVRQEPFKSDINTRRWLSIENL